MFDFNREQQAILHLTWIAFFLTFLAWFNMAPFNTTLQAVLNLSSDQIKILMICNVALTIPARIVIGSLVDRYGPREVFSGLLVFAGAVSLYFALAQTFRELLISRLLMGCVGAGFVVGIKMIAEWFPPNKMGTAQGIYAGWGNFGAAAAAFALPQIASFFSPEWGWRAATAFSGILCLIWAMVYHRCAHEIPDRGAEFPLSLANTIEVTSGRDLVLQLLLTVPLYLAVGLMIWKLMNTAPDSGYEGWGTALLLVIFGSMIFNIHRCLKFNRPRLAEGIPEEKRYAFSQIAILALVYALTFGSELAVVSMFPEFLQNNFSLSVTMAGILGSSFALFNLVTRPGGGWLADRLGGRRVLFLLVSGAVLCYGLMGEINPQWPVSLAILLAVVCSILIQAGNGATFAMVPLIRRDLTGRLAGVVGAYGNVGAVLFLTALSFMEDTQFFTLIGGYALLVLASLFFLKPFEFLHHSFHPMEKKG
ncbi:MAG: NarK family nitrate/nitrite MFS transporter [Nitrospinaceae bacterium]|nr:NarK family nitrate/nitrite MFS transporter [Nitrospinaceae bacterium]NIR53254.1 NarK family nitrate/nitrite MFS transporter [Nitrospinaceae bacterium]NIS83652.1 NarK family nitrate/nitrite MFS transporter [Nitrospinaceae bacterium]NIT80441.1 NarK family nitrate/nitrite MFS transporter [Nitrospinaceae bacterium]NIU42779.1 NarK family nitrate/nitrite MFS transporter [Nitrospinaceae bacterium]